MSSAAKRIAPKPDTAPILADLDTPAVRAAVDSVETSQCWEFLSKTRRACSVDEVATGCRLSAAVAQRALDTLVDAGFVARLKASRRTRSITYVASDRGVIIGWDPTSAAHKEVLRGIRERLRAASRKAVDTEPTGPKRRAGQALYLNFTSTRSDFHRIIGAINALADEVRAVNARGEALLERRKQSDGQASEANAEEIRHSHISVELWEVPPSDAPFVPNWTIFNREVLPTLAAQQALTPERILSPKELEVAKRLAAGESRAEVARSLGLRTNTVLTHCKRIYAKLGIDNRADLVTRMKRG